jgi:hypoxanthine-DNA glycosylase
MSPMIETNPFKVFCPSGAKYLILGSFAAKDAKKGCPYDWYYSNGRNQFWPILENIYNKGLTNKKEQQDLFSKLSIAIGDIIYQCNRTKNSSLDTHLKDIVFNIDPISEVLENNPIRKVLFTSRFVENNFRRHFLKNLRIDNNTKLVTLPSPSPRYAAMKIKEKTKIYSANLPDL